MPREALDACRLLPRTRKRRCCVFIDLFPSHNAVLPVLVTILCVLRRQGIKEDPKTGKLLDTPFHVWNSKFPAPISTLTTSVSLSYATSSSSQFRRLLIIDARKILDKALMIFSWNRDGIGCVQ